LVENGAEINQWTFELFDDNPVCLASKKHFYDEHF
jgi:hypothetical protein